MEKIRIISKLDYRALKYFNLFILKYRRRVPILMGSLSLVAVAIAAYGYFVQKQDMLAVIGIAFGAYMFYQIFSLEKRIDLNLERYFYNKKVASQTVEIDDEKITVIHSNNEDKPNEYDWSYITEINEMPQYYILMIGKGYPVIIDRSNEALINGSKEELDRIIKEKSELKPYKKVEVDIVKRPITYVHQEIPGDDVEEVESIVSDVNEEKEEGFEKVIANDEVENKDFRDLVAVDEPKVEEDKKE